MLDRGLVPPRLHTTSPYLYENSRDSPLRNCESPRLFHTSKTQQQTFNTRGMIQMTIEFLKKVEEQISAWPGITVHPHRFGGREFCLGSAEVGHMHNDGA